MTPNPMRTPGAVKPVLPILVLLLSLGCADNQPPDSELAVSGLDPEFARHLTTSDDSTLAAYCRDIGVTAVQDALTATRIQLEDSTDDPSAAERSDELFRLQLRLVKARAREYSLDDALTASLHWREMTNAERREAVRVRRRFHEVTGSASLTPQEKEAEFRKLLPRFQECAPYLGPSEVYGQLALSCLAQHRPREHRHFLDLSLASARAEGRWGYLCQKLGELGSVYQHAGQVDSMRICWDEALQIALSHRLPVHSARITSFYARHYQRLGHLALARDLFEEAVQLCRRFKGQYHELRFVRELIDYYIYLGCWDLAASTLKRAEVLLRGHERNPYRKLYDYETYLSTEQRARCEFAAGRFDVADEAYDSVWNRNVNSISYLSRPAMMLRRARDLLDHGDQERAEVIVEEGLAIAQKWPIPEVEHAFWLLKARIHMARGEHEDCRQALEAHRRIVASVGTPFPDAKLQSDVLEIQLRRVTGDPAAEVEAVAASLSHLRRTLTSSPASPEAYLVLGRTRELREVLHQLVGAAPVSGLALEMAWRRATYSSEFELSAPASGWDDCAKLVRAELLENNADQVASGLLREYLQQLIVREAVHCTYLFQGEDLIRWTASAAGVERTVLPTGRSEIAAKIEAALAGIAALPGMPGHRVSAQTRSELRDLGRELLPPRVSAGSNPQSPLLLISPDAELSLLPFAALNLSEEGYTPLVAAMDLAYLRFWRPDTPSGEKTLGVIVADPVPSGELTRRLGSYRRLVSGLEEAGHLHDVLPGSILLAQESALKQDVLDQCSRARFIHFATHVILDPQMPFFSYIPMTRPAGQGKREDAQLEIADIRTLDLRGCDLVVLAGCSSGAAYINRQSSAPGLGEAFLDAGAEAVIHTLWPVSDREAARLMQSFIDNHFIRGSDAVQALNEAQRTRLNDADGTGAHPFTWAPYRIMLSRLPGPGEN